MPRKLSRDCFQERILDTLGLFVISDVSATQFFLVRMNTAANSIFWSFVIGQCSHMRTLYTTLRAELIHHDGTIGTIYNKLLSDRTLHAKYNVITNEK